MERNCFMKDDAKTFYEQVNHARYRGQPQGHYESFFQRANHPERPLAFWTRYTVFSPKGRPENAIGELWAVFFNGETNTHVAVKKEVPFKECVFSTAAFDCRIGDARLSPQGLIGAAEKGADNITVGPYLSRRIGPAPAPALKALSHEAACGKEPGGASPGALQRHTKSERGDHRGYELARELQPQLGIQTYRPLRLGPGRRVRHRARQLPGARHGQAQDRPFLDAGVHCNRVPAQGKRACIEWTAPGCKGPWLIRLLHLEIQIRNARGRN